MSKPVRLPSGNWRIRWLNHLDQRCSATLSTWNEAQQQLRKLEAEADAVRVGERRAPPPKRSFDDLIEYWLTRRAIHKRSRRDDQSIVRRHLRPSFGGLSLPAVNVERIDAFMATRTHLSPKTVNNHVTLLLSMLNCAVDLGWLDHAPRVRKPRVCLFSTDYRYLRTKEEVHRLLDAAAADGEDAHVLYATAVYTGLRQGELAGLRWSDVDLTQRLITVQRSFRGPTKGGCVRYVPILNVLLPILRAWRLKAGGCWLVFPNQRNRMHLPSARIFQERLHRVLDAAGFPRPPASERAVHYINFHSLRHTFASHWVMGGGDLFKLQKILGHKTVQMTMRYAHLQPTAFADDLDRFAHLEPPRAEVLEMCPIAPGASEKTRHRDHLQRSGNSLQATSDQDCGSTSIKGRPSKPHGRTPCP